MFCGLEKAAPGWFCTRQPGHDGPCAAIQTNEIWIEWVEPFGPFDGPLFLRTRPETAASYQTKIVKSLGKKYENDQEALNDFMVVNWASIRIGE